MSNESTYTNHNGGCAEIQYSGDQTGNATIKPNLAGAERGIQVNADGTTRDLGPQKFNTANLPNQGITYWSSNGAKRLSASEVTDTSLVDVPGMGKMMVGAAKRMGFLTDDGTGRLSDNTKQAKEALTREEQKAPAELTNFASPDADATLMALDAAIGRNGVHETSNRIFSHLTSGKHATPEAAFEAGGKVLAEMSGIDPSVAAPALQEMYDSYRANAAQYLTSQGHDAEAVFDYASTLSASAKAALFRDILNGRGKAALDQLVRNKKARNRY